MKRIQLHPHYLFPRDDLRKLHKLSTSTGLELEPDLLLSFFVAGFLIFGGSKGSMVRACLGRLSPPIDKGVMYTLCVTVATDLKPQAIGQNPNKWVLLTQEQS